MMNTRQLVAVVLLAACAATAHAAAKLGQLGSEHFKAAPAPLEAEQGVVEVTINGLFPQKFMNKKAVVTVTPELRYTKDGQPQSKLGTSATFQGQKVQGNDQVVSYADGGSYTLRARFDYEPAMQQSELYITFTATVGKKQVQLPAVKVADGVVATSELYRRTLASASPSMSQDAFQRVVSMHQDANIKFLIEQAEIRKSELKNNSVQEFVALLQRISADRKSLNLNGVTVSAYASPDGGIELNEKLANRRQANTESYVRQQLKKTGVDSPVETDYTAQDWEGFQQLVQASDIQDKDVILRVLSMYKDPEEREQQIKNLSHGFQELADGILPELRRARLTINYETVGLDDDQLLAQLASDPSKLSVEELLYASTKARSTAEQEQTLRKTTELYPRDLRAYNNLGALAYTAGRYDEAATWLGKAQAIDAANADVNANLGLLALQQGQTQQAEGYIAKATNAKALSEALGNLHLAQGSYALAEKDFASVNSNSAALAQILNKNYAKAEQTLKAVARPDGMTDYLQAIVKARQGDRTTAASLARQAVAKDASLAAYAAADLELK